MSKNKINGKKIRLKWILALCLAVVLVLSVVLVTYFGVERIKTDLAEEFLKENENGETVAKSVDNLEMCLRTFASEYKRAVGDCPEVTILIEGAEAVNCVNGTIPRKVNVSDVLNTTNVMYQKLESEDKCSVEAKAAYRGITDGVSALRRNEDYNKAAKRYNKVSESFVGKIFGFGIALEF